MYVSNWKEFTVPLKKTTLDNNSVRDGINDMSVLDNGTCKISAIFSPCTPYHQITILATNNSSKEDLNLFTFWPTGSIVTYFFLAYYTCQTLEHFHCIGSIVSLVYFLPFHNQVVHRSSRQCETPFQKM